MARHPRRPSYRARRIRRHLGLALASVALTVAAFPVVPAEHALARLSMALAYVSLALLGASLALGPLNVLRARANPVSTDLRRDVGIWAGILALVHVSVGLQVHMGGNIWVYFFYPPDRPSRLGVRLDGFGVANYTGLGVTLILIALLALSNNRSLRRLGSRRWKAIHRSIYVGFVLLVAHGALYQLLEKRRLAFVALFAALAFAVTAIQLAGMRRTRARARHIGIGARAVPAHVPGADQDR